MTEISKEAREAADKWIADECLGGRCDEYDLCAVCEDKYELTNIIQSAIDRALSSVKEEEKEETPNGEAPTTQEQPRVTDERQPEVRERWKSIAYWPPGPCGNKIESVTRDFHDTKEAAEAVCRMLEQQGFGGEGRFFPLRTEVVTDPQIPPTTLAPCPFCGKSDLQVGKRDRIPYVDCKTCQTTTYFWKYVPWNQRVPQIQERNHSAVGSGVSTKWKVRIEDDAIALFTHAEIVRFDRLPGRVVLVEKVCDLHNATLTQISPLTDSGSGVADTDRLDWLRSQFQASSCQTSDEIFGHHDWLDIREAIDAARGFTPSVLAAPTAVKCAICDWTNVGLLNVGDVGKPKWVCHGCIKRRFDSAPTDEEVEEKDVSVGTSATGANPLANPCPLCGGNMPLTIQRLSPSPSPQHKTFFNVPPTAEWVEKHKDEGPEVIGPASTDAATV